MNEEAKAKAIEKATEKKAKLMLQKQKLQEKLKALAEAEKKNDNLILSFDEVKKEKRSERNHRLIVFAGNIEKMIRDLVEFKSINSDVLFETLTEMKEEIAIRYTEKINHLSSDEAKEAERAEREAEKQRMLDEANEKARLLVAKMLNKDEAEKPVEEKSEESTEIPPDFTDTLPDDDSDLF